MLSHKRKIAKNKKVKDQQGRFLRLRKNTLALYFFKLTIFIYWLQNGCIYGNQVLL